MKITIEIDEKEALNFLRGFKELLAENTSNSSSTDESKHPDNDSKIDTIFSKYKENVCVFPTIKELRDAGVIL